MPRLPPLLSVTHFNRDYNSSSNSNSNSNHRALLDLLVLNHVLGWEIGKQMADGVFRGVKIVIGEK
jgi:hypothetical protein